MIIPDLNILIHAYNADFPQHSAARQWWERAVNGETGPIGLAWATILGFIRISTSRSVMERPLRPSASIDVVRDWMKHESIRIAVPGEQHSNVLFRLLEDVGVAGNLTTDAHLAALAIEYRAEIATSDVDFARFKGLRWFNPLSARPGR